VSAWAVVLVHEVDALHVKRADVRRVTAKRFTWSAAAGVLECGRSRNGAHGAE
jgi:hypothetical protein